MKKSCPKKAKSLLIIGVFLFSLLSPLLVTAASSQDNDAGTWTDTFSDETGLSSSTNTAVSSGEVILDSTTPGAWTETSEADFEQGTVNKVDIQTTSGSILLESGNYSESLGTNGFSAVGTAKSWRGDDHTYEYSLPFTFSYYGSSYSTVWISTNGYIHLDSNYTDHNPTRDKLKSNKIIAPFWTDLATNGSAQSGEDIYVQENADNVIIYWKGETVVDNKPVNFSAQLYSSGTVKFHYGTGTGLQSASTYQREIGLSKGDEVSYLVSNLDDDSNLSSAQTATFSYTSGYFSSGTFISQTFDGYDNTHDKTAVSLELTTAVLPANTSVQVEYSLDGSSYSTAGTYSTTGGTGTTFTGLSGSGTSLRYRLTLSGTSSATPEVKSVIYNYTLSSSLIQTASEDFIDGTLENVDAGLTQGQVELFKTTLEETLTDREDIVTGSAQNFKTDDESLLYDLPFVFSFYGADYTQVRINSNGYLVFGEDYNSDDPSLDNLMAHKIIAPLWADLRTSGVAQSGEDIYIQENANSVEIYWKAEFIFTGDEANFSVELFDTGKIEFHYGAGNTGLLVIPHKVGVSKGDSSNFIQSVLDDDSSLELAQTSTINYTSEDMVCSGIWFSPTYDAGLPNQDKHFISLTWNKTVPENASISLQYDFDEAEIWSSEDASGTIIFPANTTAKSIRYQVNFECEEGAASPILEDITLTYRVYESSGTAITTNIDPSVGPVEWESVSFNKTTSDSTALTVDVLDTSNNVLLTNVSSGRSLTSINVKTYPAIRLRANLSTTNQSLTPSLQDWTVNWDPRAPIVIGSTDFDAFPGSGNLSIAWTATDGDTGTAGLKSNPIDIFYSYDGGTSYYQIADDTANSSPYSWDTTTVADGTSYKIKITAEDGYGMTGSEASPSATFEIDNYTGVNPNTPVVSISSPSSGDRWNGTQTISYSASDPDTGSAGLKVNPINIYYSSDDTNWHLIAAAESNSGSYSWDTTSVADSANYKIKIQAFDSEGAVGEAISESFSVDNTGPTFTVGYYSDSSLGTSLPTSGGVSQAKTGTIYLKITASESLQSAPTFGIDQQGSVDISNQSTTLVSGNVYKASYTVQTATGGTYIDGTATTSVSGTDLTGNPSTGISSGNTFNIDTSTPSAPTISSPTNNQVFLSTTGSITVAGTAEANSTVTITVGSTNYTTTASSNGTYSRGLITLSGGIQTISVKATDAAGNESSSTSISVKLNRKPSISISSPTSSSVFLGSSNTISWTASDGDSDSLIYQVEYSADGGSTWNTLVSFQTSTSYSWNVTSLADGSTYRVKVTADDDTETSSATSATFSIYSTKPTVTISDIGTTDDSTPTFTGTASSSKTTIDTVKYRLGTTGDWSTATADDGTFDEASEDYSFTLSTLGDGSYTVYVKARDANQYYSDTASDSFTIDTTPAKRVDITSPLEGAILDPTDDTNTSLEETQIQVKGTVEAEATVKLYLNDSYLKSVTASSSDTFTFSDVTLVYGTNELTVTANHEDEGDLGSDAVTVTYTSDKDAPLVTLDPFEQNPTKDSTPLLTGTVKETFSKVMALEYSFNAGLTWLKVPFSWGEEKEFSFAFESIELKDSDYVFQVRAKDKDENIGYSAKEPLTIDTTPPFIGGSLIIWGSQYLLPDRDGLIEVPIGAEIDFLVALSGKDMVLSQLRVGERTMDLNLSSSLGLWRASFTIEEEGEQSLVVSVTDELGNLGERLIATFVTSPGGYVLAAATGTKVEGALVTLYFFEETTQEWVVWDGAAYDQRNPVLTGGDGSYSFSVPPGKYYLTVEKEGYALYQSPVILVEKNKMIGLKVSLVRESPFSKVEEKIPVGAAFGTGVFGLLLAVQIVMKRLLWLS